MTSDGTRNSLIGSDLPKMIIPVTSTLTVAAAIASRDFHPIHHDRAHAVASGLKDIITNILTTAGLVSRFITDWCGPKGRIRACSLRLFAPNYPGDVLRFSGRVITEVVEGTGVVLGVEVSGKNSRGEHAAGRVFVALGVREDARGGGEARNYLDPLPLRPCVSVGKRADPVRAQLERWITSAPSLEGVSPLPVNDAMIRNWCEALGDQNPLYSPLGGRFAPPAMLQSWTRPGLASLTPEQPSPRTRVLDILKAAGFTGVIATNWMQETPRYLEVGEMVAYASRIIEISTRKATALGTGYFVTEETRFMDFNRLPVGRLLVRGLSYAPNTAAGCRE